ncbi:hypothetical protein AB835_11480 [Candidatus Endobugula sertula]|uniref:Adenylate synthase n=1 Tax=Candidatus Endobugula sertula TaxID=62101 RepID=A0A1D2QN18_9GAMM|nr:hypothetical protein AB835_11480 [Candidatus Endobugula sertula]
MRTVIGFIIKFNSLFKNLKIIRYRYINTLNLSLKACEQHGLKAENNRDFSPKLKGVSVGLSSGTSQQRGVFLVSPCEQALWAGYMIAKNITFSFRKKRVALFLRSNSNLYESASGLLIRFRFFDLTKPFDQLIEELEEYNPHILIAPAHVLGVIAQHRADIKPEKMISVAEVLEETVKEQVEARFSCRLGEIYQATEGYIASTCSHGNLHINEDILIVEKEWVDKDDGRFVPIITDLNRHTLPIIRYRLNDILVEETAPCSCGSQFTHLKRIEGREDDMLWLPDSNSAKLTGIFPDLIRRAMYICQTQVSDYRIEQNGKTITIAYDSDDTKQAEKDIATTLAELFSRLNVDKLDIKFSLGIDHDMMKKQRRIACYKKPNCLD